MKKGDLDDEAKPRVLIVTGVLWIGGGAEKVAASLGNYLTDRGYETHLLTFYEAPEKFPYHGIYHTFGEQPKTRLQKILRIPVRIYKIARYAKENKIDIAFAFLEEANFYTLVAKLCFLRQLPVIVSVRNNIRQRSLLFRTLSSLLYPYAKTVVSVTKTVEEMLKEDFKLTNTTTIYNPLDMPMIERKKEEPLPTEYEWLKGRSPLLISIGRLISQKGQWHLIRAFSAVVTKHRQANLVIIGALGDYQKEILKLIGDCGLEGKVHLIGKQQNVYQFLNAADLFVFSSRWEGMPNTMLEALSVGLPIITPDCPSGPREIIAPEVEIGKEITYPLTTPYGILTTPFPSAAAPIWQPPAVVPLTPEEKVLASAISDTLLSGWRRGPDYSDYKKRIAEAFDYNTIMKQWEELLF